MPSIPLSRRPAVLLAVFFSFAAVFLLMLLCMGWTSAWHHVAIPAFPWPYFDMRLVQSAPQALAAGLDPRLSNPGDIVQRPMDYPIVWAHLARLLELRNERNFLLVVTLYVAAYLACCAVLLYRYPSLWMLLAVLSGSSLFAIERGNNDLVIFVLLFAAVSLDSAWLGAALLLLATYLKLFPAFAALFLLRSRAVFWSFLAAAGLYLVVDHTEIAKVTGAVPVSADFAFGIPSLRWWLWLFFRNHPSTSVLVGFFLGCIAIGCGICLRWRIPVPRTADRLAERLFLAGSGIYLAAFTLNSNFDYRLIFVLLCIPWLASSRCGRGMATTLLVCCLVASNAFLTTSLLGLFWGGLLAQAGNSALYIGLAVLLILQLLSRSAQTAALRPACNSLHSTYPPCPGS